MQRLFEPNAATDARHERAVTAGWVVVLLLLWQVFRPPVLPGPAEVFAAIGTLWQQGVLTEELGKSLAVNIRAILWSVAISLTVSYLTVLTVARFPANLMATMRFLGLTGLTLPFTLLFGGGNSLRVAILTFAMTAAMVTSMSDVVANIEQGEFDHARTMRMKPWRAVWEVVVLGKSDQAFDVLRSVAAIGWMMLPMVEVISQSGGGIGLVLYKWAKLYEKLPEVLAIILVLITIGFLQDRIIRYLKHVVRPDVGLKLERR